MASRKLTPLEQALKTLRDPDGTGRTKLSHGFSGKPLEQVSGPPNETATPAYRNAALALRHARAFAAVVRAAKALRRARRSDVNRVGPVAWGAAYGKATEAHDKAVDRLVAVENEVKRGQ